jgi:molybdate transport system substrate-binding protein
MGSRSKLTTAAAVAVLVVLAGCGSPPAATTSITVFASPSLIGPFGDIGKSFRAQNPTASVEFLFADSQGLAEQLVAGAHADVFASADSINMRTVVDADQLSWGPETFASNTLVVATAPGNPKKIASFADLNRPGLTVAVCAPPGNCAADTRRLEDSTGVYLQPTKAQPSDNGVLSMVSNGQADAGVVYLTSAFSAGDKVTSVRIPQAVDAIKTYTIGLPKSSEQAVLAKRFIDLVIDDVGQGILARAGFGTAPTTS